jgi:hypothetical protein
MSQRHVTAALLGLLALTASAAVWFALGDATLDLGLAAVFAAQAALLAALLRSHFAADPAHALLTRRRWIGAWVAMVALAAGVVAWAAREVAPAAPALSWGFTLLAVSLAVVAFASPTAARRWATALA